MPIQIAPSSAPSNVRQRDPAADLRDHANRAVMNKDLEPASAPAGLGLQTGLPLQLSQRDQRENGVVARTAFHVDGQVYLRDEVMKSNGSTEEVWRHAKRPLR